MAAVYLLAVGGPVFASLTCRCITGDVQGVHVCCRHCDHKPVPVVMAEPCCGDYHSTDIVLYTTPSHDSEKFVKRAASADFPAALAADAVFSVGYVSEPCGVVAERCVPAVPESHVSSCGLRAPPVLV